MFKGNFNLNGGTASHGATPRGVQSVSYTHLDVYKRQVLDILGTQWCKFMQRGRVY